MSGTPRLGAGEGLDAVLVGGAGEDRGLAAAGRVRDRARAAEPVVVHRRVVGVVPGDRGVRGAGLLQLGAADPGHQRVAGLPVDLAPVVVAGPAEGDGGGAGVARGGEDADVVAVGIEDAGPQLLQLRGASVAHLGAAERLADHRAELVIDDVLLGLHDLPLGAAAAGGGRLDQHDRRARRDRVRVLHVQRGLVLPARHVRVLRIELRDLADRLDDRELGRRWDSRTAGRRSPGRT